MEFFHSSSNNPHTEKCAAPLILWRTFVWGVGFGDICVHCFDNLWCASTYSGASWTIVRTMKKRSVLGKKSLCIVEEGKMRRSLVPHSLFPI